MDGQEYDLGQGLDIRYSHEHIKCGKGSFDHIQNKVSDPQFFLSFANDYYANIVNEAQT